MCEKNSAHVSAVFFLLDYPMEQGQRQNLLSEILLNTLSSLIISLNYCTVLSIHCFTTTALKEIFFFLRGSSGGG